MGPIIAWDDVDRLCNHFCSANEVLDYVRIEEYLVTNLNAPPIEKSYGEFNAAFTDARWGAENAAREWYKSARAKKAKTKDVKRSTVEKMLVDLSAMIEESFCLDADRGEKESGTGRPKTFKWS